MNTFLIQLGTMSIQASVAILVVVGLRKIFAVTGVSKKYDMFLWMIPFLLLICPWKISVPVGFWNAAPSDYNEQYTEYTMERWAESLLVTERVQGQISMEEVAEIDNVTAFEPGNAENADTEYHGVESDMLALQKMLKVATYIWLAGLVIFLLHATVSYALLKKKLSCCVQKEDGTYRVDDLPVPMVVGFLKPQIYLPSGVAEEHVAFAVEHEKTHIRRKDPITKLVAYVIVCVHWFNPLVWMAYHLFEKDMEMACDEETLQRIGTAKKKAYATALVQLSVGTRRVLAVPLAFGEGDTKGRIKNVMHYKKTVKSAAILAVTAGLLILAVFMTKTDYDVMLTNKGQSILNAQQEEIFQAEQEKFVAQGTPGEAENSETGYQSETEKKELTFDMVREAAANHTLHELDFHGYSNGVEQYSKDENALNYYVNFYYDYEGEVYKIGASYLLENDDLWSVYITRESDGAMRWLYQDKDGLLHQYSDFLEPLLETKENVEEWLSVELPEGYSVGNYQEGVGIVGGALILPQAYELYGDDVFAPKEWYHAGFIGLIPKEVEFFEFSGGKLTDARLTWWNHTEMEKLEILELDWEVLFAQGNHDLYTAAGVDWLEEDGIDVSRIDTTSDYWYFFFAKEGEETAYYLSLSQNLFTKEEAIAIAETVDIFE